MIEFLLGGELGPEGQLQWTAPDWIVLLAVVGAVVGVVLASVGRRAAVARGVEAVSAAVGLGGLVVMLAGPTWVEEEGRTEPGRTVVLVDASRSMGVREGGRARSEDVAEVLDHVRREVGEVEVFHFGDDLAVGEPESFELAGTDVEGAMQSLGERVAGERLGGVVLLTDGLDRGLLRRRFQQEQEAAAPPELAGPLTVFQIGRTVDVQDLSVRSVDAGGYAFIRAPFAITAEIQGIGSANRSIPVTLQRDGATVTEQRVVLDAEGRATVRFDVVAEDAGRFAYAVTVPVYEGDAVPANNTMPVVVKVVRDRIRVLQVAGAPSWDVKFLRRFLKDDPSVQLVSFFILRTQRDLASQYSDRELSLIQFPYERLFAEDLWTFDVVVFQNFDYAPYFQFNSTQLLDNLRRYVEQGGALVMMGGDRSFGLGQYGGTPLAQVLPVEIAREETPDLAPFLPDLTEDGARHPITRVVSDGVENEAWWSRLHELDGTNVVTRARDDAAVLLAHPSRKDADGEPLPILSVREVGAGRTMALTVDSSWRWSLSEAAVGRGNQVYLRFWKNALRWLMKDTTVSRVTVETPRENYAVGEDVRVVVRVRDPGFAALPDARVTAEVDNEGRVSKLEGRTSADGDLVLVVPAERPGTHRVKVSVKTRDQEAVGDAETVFAVTTRDPETDEIAPDSRFLQWLAASTSGRYHGPGELGPVAQDPGAGRVVNDRRETPLWRAPALGAVVLGALGLAWLVRRRAGMR